MKRDAVDYLLDTITVSLIVKKRSQTARNKLNAVARSRVAISIISELELRFGIIKNSASRSSPQHMADIRCGWEITQISIYGYRTTKRGFPGT